MSEHRGGTGWPSVPVCIPSTDHAFKTHVQAALVSLQQQPQDVATAARLQAELRKAYPEAVVHEKDRLATLGSAGTTFYAYRDRNATHRSPSDDWWEDRTLARTTLAGDGRYLDANAAAARLFGVSRKRILASRAGDFTRHEGSHLAEPLLATLQQTGQLDSTAVVVRPDGSEIAIAYRMIRDGDGPGRHVTVMRAVGDQL